MPWTGLSSENSNEFAKLTCFPIYFEIEPSLKVKRRLWIGHQSTKKVTYHSTFVILNFFSVSLLLALSSSTLGQQFIYLCLLPYTSLSMIDAIAFSLARSAASLIACSLARSLPSSIACSLARSAASSIAFTCCTKYFASLSTKSSFDFSTLALF